MSATTSFQLAEKAYLRWHNNDALNQRVLAAETGLSHSIVNNILRGKHKYSAALREKYPQLKRTTRVYSKEPVNHTPVADVELEPEIDLAAETLEALPNLKPQVAVVLTKNCFGELSELLRLVNAPLCPRLAKILGPHPGRPGKNQKDEDSARQAAEEELAECERASKEFLEERIK